MTLSLVKIQQRASNSIPSHVLKGSKLLNRNFRPMSPRKSYTILKRDFLRKDLWSDLLQQNDHGTQKERKTNLSGIIETSMISYFCDFFLFGGTKIFGRDIDDE